MLPALSPVSDVKNALLSLARGGFLMLCDDSGPEPAAYLMCGAAEVRPEDISLMVNEGRGVVLAALPEVRRKELGLPLVPRSREAALDFTVSVEARHGVSTGISAADRARTLQVLSKTRQPNIDLVTPGHIFPVRAKNGGVLVRSGVPEAAVDMLVMSGLNPVAALCHCLDQHGDLLECGEASKTAVRLDIPLVSVADVIRERLAHEPLIEPVAEAVLPVRGIGEFLVHCFRSHIDGSEHVALVYGDLKSGSARTKAVLVRVQAEDLVADLLGSSEESRRHRMHTALARIAQEGAGIFVYVRHPAPGFQSYRSYGEVQQTTAASQLREYGIGAQILSHLGARRIRLLTSSPRVVSGIEAFQIEILEQIPF